MQIPSAARRSSRVTDDNPWGQSAYAVWLERRPDTPLNRRLGLFTRHSGSFTPSDGDLEAQAPTGEGEIRLGALIRLPDLAAFREHVLFTRRSRPVSVVLPAADGQAPEALELLLAPPHPAHAEDAARRAPNVAKRLRDADCCALRVWLDDHESSVDVFGPAVRVSELDAVVRPLLADLR